MKNDKFNLKIEASLENLTVISNVISNSMKHAHIDAAIIPDVLQAVDEACTNIILYAYPKRKGYIRLTWWLNHRDLVISIEDKGRPFNPCSVAPPELDVSLEDRKVGGLGIYFIRKFMDRISYEYNAGTGNRLIMRKHLRESGLSVPC